MKKTKKLSLDRQTIALLTPQRLRQVRGGCGSDWPPTDDDETYRDITPMLSRLTCEG